MLSIKIIVKVANINDNYAQYLGQTATTESI